MSKKGIIFTLDATIATVIFLIAISLLFRIFTDTSVSALSGAGIYTDSDDYLRSNEKNNYFSSVYNLYQRGDNVGAQALLDLIAMEAPYKTNLKLCENCNQPMEIKIESKNYNFTENVFLRKLMVFTIERGLIGSDTDNVNVDVESFRSGDKYTFLVGVNNPGVNPISVNITAFVLDYLGSDYEFTISPETGYLDQTILQLSRTFEFNVTGSHHSPYYMQPDIINPVDQYMMNVNVVSNDTMNETATDEFNLMKFGMVEMEVGV